MRVQAYYDDIIHGKIGRHDYDGIIRAISGKRDSGKRDSGKRDTSGRRRDSNIIDLKQK